MGYGDPKDARLDRTQAWWATALMLVALSLVGVLSQHLYQNYAIERDAIKGGYCEVASQQGAIYGYHWEKCQAPATPAK